MHLHMIIVSNMTRILADLDCTIHVRKVHRWVSIGLVSEQEFGPGAILTKNSSKNNDKNNNGHKGWTKWARSQVTMGIEKLMGYRLYSRSSKASGMTCQIVGNLMTKW